MVVNYCIDEYGENVINGVLRWFDTDLYQIEVDQKSDFEPEEAYLRSIAGKCVEHYFSDMMEDCGSCTVAFNDPTNENEWHVFRVVTLIRCNYHPRLFIRIDS